MTMMNGHEPVSLARKNGVINHFESEIVTLLVLPLEVDSLGRYFLKFEKYNPHPSYPDVDLKERVRGL